MGMLSSPNIVPLVLALIVAVSTGWLGWSNTESGSWQRYAIMGVATISIAAIKYLWDIPLIRLHTFRLWYRILGPSYQIEAGGEVNTKSLATDSELLHAGLSAVKGIYRTAIPDTPITSQVNRLDIKANRHQTVRIDLPQIASDELLDDEMPDDEVFGDEEAISERLVRFRVWGSGGHVNRVEAMLGKEIAPLIQDLSSALGPLSSPGNYWVRVSMDGVNPFLRFYLRDVSDIEIKHFRLNFVRHISGDSVSTSITEDGFRVSGRKPTVLISCARDCLSAPALTHVDSR